jgi:serine/threonine protein phosphatase 1
VTECIDLLATIPDLVQIMGNHDDWTRRYLGQQIGNGWFDSDEYRCWYGQGGKATIISMNLHDSRKRVFDFLSKSIPFYVDNFKLFTHGGIDPKTKVEDYDPDRLMWNRSMVKAARYEMFGSNPLVINYDEVFVGHTPTVCYDQTTPINWSNVWMLDTGASYPDAGGRLTVMDADTKEFWSSDPVAELYPNEKAR